MWKWIKDFWFDLCVFDLSYDLEIACSIDLVNIMFGRQGVSFRGSLFMLYRETPDSHYRDGKAHWAWDLFYYQAFRDIIKDINDERS